MSSDRLKTQIQFENILSGSNPVVWSNMTKAGIKAFVFNPSHNVLFSSALKDDACDFYFKGLLSVNEGLSAIDKKNFSWATVKLYYSVYYFLRCSLCCHGVGFVRKERDGYWFQNKVNESPKANGKPDHMAAIDLFKQLFSAVDFLQSNSIVGSNAYEWLRHQRENVNYKYRTFFEPDIPLFWESISEESDNGELEYWIEEYINEDIYCFLEDHAVVALPIKRMILTHRDLIAKKTAIVVRPDKEMKLKEFMKENQLFKLFKPYYRGFYNQL